MPPMMSHTLYRSGRLFRAAIVDELCGVLELFAGPNGFKQWQGEA
jgi:hypothetical protein